MNIHIYYGSTAGNTYIVVAHIYDIFQSAWHDVALYSTLEQQHIIPADAYIFASGTYWHGLLQEHIEKCLRMNNNYNFQQKPCAAIWLWDDMYDAEYNIEAAPILSDFIVSHNGNEIMPALKINKSPLPYLESSIEDWANDFLTKLTL